MDPSSIENYAHDLIKQNKIYDWFYGKSSTNFYTQCKTITSNWIDNTNNSGSNKKADNTTTTKSTTDSSSLRGLTVSTVQ